MRNESGGLRRYAKDFLKSRTALAGFVILISVLAMALFAPLLAPYRPDAMNIAERLTPPFTAKGSGFHLLGTDALGRDILSRLIYGARISLLIGVTSVLVGGTAGVFLGLVSGFKGGVWDNLIMRIVDIQMAVPFLVLALAVIAVLGNGLLNVILVMGITSWTMYARTVRAEVLSLKEQDFVQMARVVGVPEWKIVLRHVLPNVSSSIIVIGALQVARMILFEASLSFLGLGVPPSIPTWGAMVADGRNYVGNAWWISTIPGLMIFLTVIGINLIGNRLRDQLDPRLASR